MMMIPSYRSTSVSSMLTSWRPLSRSSNTDSHSSKNSSASWILASLGCGVRVWVNTQKACGLALVPEGLHSSKNSSASWILASLGCGVRVRVNAHKECGLSVGAKSVTSSKNSSASWILASLGCVLLHPGRVGKALVPRVLPLPLTFGT